MLAKITGKDHAKDHEVLQRLAASIEKLPTEHVFKTLTKIVIRHDVLNVKVSVSHLKKVLHEAHELILKTAPQLDDIYSFEILFMVGKSWHGAVVIRPPSKGTPEDMFDLPPHDLRDLIRGFIWRDEHFKGMTIREIAKRDKRSDAFVGGMIRKTFEIA